MDAPIESVMTLKHHSNADELKEFMNKYDKNPFFHPFWHAIKFTLEGVFPTIELSLYSYEMGTFELLIAYNKNKLTDDYIMLFCDGELNGEHFKRAMAEFFRLRPLDKRIVVVGEERIANMLSTYITENASPFRIVLYPCRMFYMNESQMEAVRELKVPELPHGYELGSADPDKDAEIITKTWRHARANEMPQTKAKLTNLPSSCVRYEGEPVGFEMMDAAGLLNHLFVLEEHRRKGLGTIIELDLAKKIINNGCKVYKCVELYNKSVLTGSERSPYWSSIKDDAGNDVLVVFAVVYKEE
ncbi:unnamed protein product [Cylicocyclus nassatus]|uniref:Glycine N-acyltransferase-like protein n=1 Tax=Cylicocyclus nassatus TaxID=53992 RepID=A0AA36GI56_CYLNA|nr:unnamed protein product [Cylicocyclus nassatus]